MDALHSLGCQEKSTCKISPGGCLLSYVSYVNPGPTTYNTYLMTLGSRISRRDIPPRLRFQWLFTPAFCKRWAGVFSFFSARATTPLPFPPRGFGRLREHRSVVCGLAAHGLRQAVGRLRSSVRPVGVLFETLELLLRFGSVLSTCERYKQCCSTEKKATICTHMHTPVLFQADDGF